MKILFLQKRILFPVDCGWKIRTLNVLKPLAQRHEITYVCNVQAADAQYLQEMETLGIELKTIPWSETPKESLRFYGDLAWNLLSPYPFTASKDYDPTLRRVVSELLSSEHFDLAICDFVQMARNIVGLPAPATLLFQHNVEARIFERHAIGAGGFLRRQYMRLQHRKMHRFESHSGRWFDGVIAVSNEDRRVFESEYGWDHVQVIDTAVDVEYFLPQPGKEIPGRVVFVGSLDWLPNQDGITRFVECIWPAIRRRSPHASFQVIGRNPPSAMLRLGQIPGVEIVGTVPDVRPHLAEAEVVVVPLWVGGGTRLKIFEAFAMEKAVVSTSLGAEGLDLTPDEHLLIEDSNEGIASQIMRLLEESDIRHRLAGSARQLVLENFSAGAVAEQFERICLQTVDRCRNASKSADSAR